MSAIVFQMPEKVSMEKVDNFYSTFTFKPLEKGYGVTIGNTLRRVLLSSLEGYAITSIKIPGAQHEFSTIEGVVEDIVELILNLKQVRFKKIADNANDKICISIKKQEVFKAGDIAKFTPALEILNPDFVICHLDPIANIELEIMVEKGRGYIPAEENKPANAAIGLIPIDAIFTPIKKVSYKVENIRVEQKTDYEKLIIDIQTDGSIHPEQALERAASLIIKHFLLFSDNNMVLEASSDEEIEIVDEELLRVRKLLKTPLAELGLSVRAFNCLKAAEVKTLGDLAGLEISDMVKFRNFGKKSLKELEELMVSKNLNFGMDLSKYKLDEV
ncbi:MAG TPA: DNA-directed RNA polymerase subunit alpha [Amoebophilaceae bacterium]|nr:DNA-directed RNA polymerase subunit alpha [Amoebophilaceae bacterium]